MPDPLHDSRILVIDDDPEILELVRLLFDRTGAHVWTARDARQGLRQFYDHRPDLVILDLMMPGLNGWDTCERLRELSDVPIMMLTALKQNGDIARGLDHGADDFVSKPFANQVLLARARALLRREERSAPGQRPHAYDDGYLSIDLERRRVRVRQQPAKLTPTEYKLLAYLLKHAGRVLTHEQILEQIWGPECLDSTHYVHVYVHRLRQKLEQDPEHPRYLLTEPGVGYRFEPPPAHPL
jgi:two-component system KDP operon response regulator KdpE